MVTVIGFGVNRVRDLGWSRSWEAEQVNQDYTRCGSERVSKLHGKEREKISHLIGRGMTLR